MSMKHITKKPWWHKLMTAFFAFVIFQGLLFGPSAPGANAAVIGIAPSEYHSVSRIAGENRSETSRKIADAMKDVLGIESFDAIIYASGQDFADALAGSYLSAKSSAPILLHTNSSFDSNISYIRSNLSENGVVYILGGANAVPETVDSALSECAISVRRISGKDRYETNLEILKAAGFHGGRVLVCTSQEFADSLSASATGLPILLVSKDWKYPQGLSNAYKEYLSACERACKFTIIGGYCAVSLKVEADLSQYGSVERICGDSRYETSVKVAEHFFSAPSGAVLAYAKNFPDGLCGGPLAYALHVPMLLVTNNHREPAASLVEENNVKSGIALGGNTLISDPSVRNIFALDDSVMFPGAEPHDHDFVSTTIPSTCIQLGCTKYKCACGDSYVESNDSYGDHTWSSWEVVKKATSSAEGLQTRFCICCSEEESEKIPKTSYMDDSVVTLNTSCNDIAVNEVINRPDKDLFGKHYKEAQLLYTSIRNRETKQIELVFEDYDECSAFWELFCTDVLSNVTDTYSVSRENVWKETGVSNQWECVCTKLKIYPNEIYETLYEIIEVPKLAYKANLSAGVYNGMSKSDAVSAIYFWLCSNIGYQHEAWKPVGVFENHTGNCLGYATAFYYMCQNANIPVKIVSGCAYNPNNNESACPGCHAWNRVKLDGTWYYLDTCWGYYLTESLWYPRSIENELMITQDGVLYTCH